MAPTMRTRRIVTLSVLAAVGIAVASMIGLPKLVGDNLTGIEQGLTDLAQGVQPKEATIFDPPKYSLDEASSLWVVVNKHRPLSPLKYKPESLSYPAFAKPKVQNPFGLQLRTEAAKAVAKMALAMEQEGAGRLVLNSGFRSYKNQLGLYERTRDLKGLDVAEKLSARAGFSEHQTGLAADFSAAKQGCSIMVCFGKTTAGQWLKANAYKFGFILRYPAKYTDITGYQYEPWHFRFVGEELALEVKNRGVKTLEQFWNLEAAPDYLTSPN